MYEGGYRYQGGYETPGFTGSVGFRAVPVPGTW